MEYAIAQHDPDVLWVETKGRMTSDDFIAMSESLLGQKRTHKESHVVFDHRQLDFSGIGVEVLEDIRVFHKKHDAEIGAGRCAILVQEGAVGQWDALWMQGKKILVQNQVKVFDDAQAALQWVCSL